MDAHPPPAPTNDNPIAAERARAAPVRVVGMNLRFDDVFFLVLSITVSQAIIGGLVLLVLLWLGVL